MGKLLPRLLAQDPSKKWPVNGKSGAAKAKVRATLELAAMNAGANDGELDESSSIKLYMELTGASEASARSVYMFVNREKDEEERKSNGLDTWRIGETEIQPSVAKSSPVRTESDEEPGIGLFGTEGLALAGK